jgi:hypothetical protein
LVRLRNVLFKCSIGLDDQSLRRCTVENAWNGQDVFETAGILGAHLDAQGTGEAALGAAYCDQELVFARA